MRTFLRLFSLFYLVSCAGVPPYQSRKVKIWNGAPEEAGICRLSTADLTSKARLPFPVKAVKKIHQGYIGTECLSATDQAFKQYACLTFQDLGVLHEYIETLIYSCKKW